MQNYIFLKNVPLTQISDVNQINFHILHPGYDGKQVVLLNIRTIEISECQVLSSNESRYHGRAAHYCGVFT